MHIPFFRHRDKIGGIAVYRTVERKEHISIFSPKKETLLFSKTASFALYCVGAPGPPRGGWGKPLSGSRHTNVAAAFRHTRAIVNHVFFNSSSLVQLDGSYVLWAMTPCSAVDKIASFVSIGAGCVWRVGERVEIGVMDCILALSSCRFSRRDTSVFPPPPSPLPRKRRSSGKVLQSVFYRWNTVSYFDNGV